MKAVLKSLFGRDVKVVNESAQDEAARDQVDRSRNWGRANHQTSLENIVLTGDEKHMHDMHDSMSMCDE